MYHCTAVLCSSRGVDVPLHCCTVQYPYAGTGVMLALWPETNYSTQFVIFGGQSDKDSLAPRPGLLVRGAVQYVCGGEGYGQHVCM